MSNLDEDEVRGALITGREQMALRYDNDAGMDSIRLRAQEPPAAPPRHRRRWALPAAAAAVVFATGAGVAVAAGVLDDGSDKAFQHLHPSKSQIGASTEQAHQLIGSFAAAGGETTRVYVSIPAGPNSCVLVTHVDSHSQPIDSIGYCGQETTEPSIRDVNDALVGWVPDPAVSQVTVTTAGYSQSTAVVSQHFVLSPASGTISGAQEVITGHDSSGAVVSTWHVAQE